jgi:antitoxin component YwqK of YwqJK toxin-antitoxin module
MNQRERLALCSSCINRKLDFEHGYVCSLTGKFADFEESCKDYKLDETVTDTIKIRTEDRPFVPLFDPVTASKKSGTTKNGAKKKGFSEVALEKLRRYQSFLYALIGGLLVGVVVSLGWALITYTTGYQGAYMALGVGLLIGFSVRYFGAGIKRIFGVLAALLTLVGSLLGYYLSQAGFPQEVKLAAMIGVLHYLNPDLMLNTMRDSFVPLDLLFYGLAVVLAYLLAIRRINSKKRINLELDSYRGAPVLYWLRLPLILVLIVALIGIPAYYGFTHTGQGPGGLNTLYYDSGEKMSEGEMRNGLETGEWTSWHENGNIKSTGYYVEGQKDSLWQWYDESGILTGTGMYSNGLENGTWMNYYPDGVVSDSGTYLEGMKEGLWKHFHETGDLMSAVPFKAGKMDGEKILLDSSGDVVKIEQYENGILLE